MPRKNYLRAFLENLDDIVFVINYPAMTFRYISPSVKARGVTPEEVYADPSVLFNMVDKQTGQLLTKQLHENIHKGTMHFEYPLTLRNGEVKWYSSSMFMMDKTKGRQTLGGVTRDITGQKKTEKALQAAKEIYEDLYNNAPNGCHSLDADGAFARINDTALAWLGYSREQLLGKPFSETVLSPASKQLFDTKFPLLKEKGFSKGLQLEFVRKNGSVLHCLVNAKTIKDKNGSPVRTRAILTDIGEIKKKEEKLRQSQLRQKSANKALNQAAQKLERLNFSKDVLLNIVSHDLRSPLEVIKMISDLLQGKYKRLDAETVLKYLQYINEASNHASNILEDLTQWTRLNDERIYFRLKKTDIRPIIEEAIEINTRKATEKGIQLAYEQQSAPKQLKAKVDAKWLARALDNIIYNAIKFSNKGDSIKVECHSAVHHIVLTVGDTGIGMPESVISELFNKFVVSSRLGTAGETGTGLGLSIVKQIIDMQSGEINVQSMEGVGSTFEIRLPIP